MSTVAPVVRHMLLCREVRRDPTTPNQIDLLGWFTGVRPGPSGSYPLWLPDLTVCVQLTGGRDEGAIRIAVREADTDALIYNGLKQTLPAFPDPLTVRLVTFRVRGCTIPRAGLYWVQLCYNDEVIAEEPLTAR